MRVSIDKDDPGFRPDADKWRVRLDGMLALNVITADDVKGYVVRYQTNADGLFIHDDQKRPRIERINGRVELIAPAP